MIANRYACHIRSGSRVRVEASERARERANEASSLRLLVSSLRPISL